MQFRSLTSKLLAVYLPLVLLSLTALFALQGVDFYYRQRAQLIGDLQQIALIQSQAAATAIWELDTGRLRSAATEIGRLDNIQGFRIEDESGAVLTESGDPDLAVESPDFLVTRAIVYDSGAGEEKLGKLIISGNSDFIWRDLKSQIQEILLSLVVLLMALVGATLLANRIVIGRPVKLLHRSITEARSEGVARKVEWHGHDELAQVVDAYNDLLDAQEVSKAEIRQYQDNLEHQVNERTEELRKVVQAVEQSPLCIVITDIKGSIEHVNPTFTRMTGYEPHEVIGKNSRVLKSGKNPPEMYDSLWETILSGKVWQNEIRNRKKNGKLYWVSISIAPVTNDEGRVTHFVAMIDDITRAKRAEDELSRQRMVLTSIIDTIPDWIFVKDKDGCFTHLNSAQVEFMGGDRKELLGTTAYDQFTAEDAASFRTQDLKVLEGESFRNNEWITFPDGTQHPMETTKLPFRDNAGEIEGILGISRDMTEQHAAEAKLKASMERFRVLFEQSSDAHLIFADNKIIECNNAAVEMLHCEDKQDLLGRQPSEFSPKLQPDGRSSAEIGDEMDAIVLEQGFHRFDFTHRRFDGEEFQVQVTLTQISLDDRPAILGVWNDLSEHKAAEKALEKAREEAEVANQTKSKFLASMSHELRTPMNAILGYSEMLIEEAEDTGQDDFVPDLKKINQAGTHLLALINDILDLSKIESGKMEAFPEAINLDSLIDEVAATAYPLMEKNGNKLTVQRGKNLDNAFQDLTKLRQALLNLLSNAAKFTQEGTVTLRAERLTEENTDWLTLAVSDTGIGIAQDKLDHVFDEFAQADNTTTRNYGGTGLGLAISRRFCKLLGGDLGVHSKPGKGSTFTIRVPADYPGSQSLQQHATTPVETAEKVHKDIEDITPGSAILVIDDDPEACELIERNLTKDGFSVVTATSGEQGLRLAGDIQPAAITLDVMMPDLDGWSVLRALKADPVLRHIPVIMLTMIDDRSRGYSLGAVDYLTKPVDREQLRKTMSRYLREGKPGTVMLVEDDLETRDMMARTLEKTGWDVSEAGNGQEALDLLATNSTDLILLDLMMPVMDGFGFLAEMRVRPELQHIPVIVVTAKDLTADDRDRLSGMVEQVLEKSPYTREQLLEYVREAVAACNINREGSTGAGNQDEQDTAG